MGTLEHIIVLVLGLALVGAALFGWIYGTIRWARARGRRPWVWLIITYIGLNIVWMFVRPFVQ